MILYHFLKEEYALDAIKNQCLKVSNFAQLNDPFELLFVSLKEKHTREVWKANKRRLTDIFRLVCFSKNWDSPLLWGHYADNHKGLALKFDIDESLVQEVLYRKNRPLLSDEKMLNKSELEYSTLIKKIMTTKYVDWSYEKEWRMIVTQTSTYSDNQLEFIKFDEKFKLVGVVKGSINHTSDRIIKERNCSNQQLQIIQARCAFNTYRIVPKRS